MPALEEARKIQKLVGNVISRTPPDSRTGRSPLVVQRLKLVRAREDDIKLEPSKAADEGKKDEASHADGGNGVEEGGALWLEGKPAVLGRPDSGEKLSQDIALVSKEVAADYDYVIEVTTTSREYARQLVKALRKEDFFDADRSKTWVDIGYTEGIGGGRGSISIGGGSAMGGNVIGGSGIGGNVIGGSGISGSGSGIGIGGGGSGSGSSGIAVGGGISSGGGGGDSRRLLASRMTDNRISLTPLEGASNNYSGENKVNSGGGNIFNNSGGGNIFNSGGKLFSSGTFNFGSFGDYGKNQHSG